MKTVNAYYSHALYRYALSQGVEMPLQSSARHSKRVRLEMQDQAWTYLHQTLGNGLGVDFGRQLKPSDMGTFGHLLVSVDTLRDALNQLQYFYPLVGEGGDVSIARASGNTLISYQPYYQIARQVRVETVLTSFVAIARQITYEPVAVLSLSLDYQPDPKVLEDLKVFVGCEVLTEQQINSIVLSDKVLAMPLYHANPSVAQSIIPLLTADLDALSQLSPKEKVQRLLARQPYLNREQVAERMHMSQRSLGRALKAHDTDFAEEKKAALLTSAEQALREGHTVAQVADQLRYSDASAFIKAYRNWTGKTPGQNRTN